LARKKLSAAVTQADVARDAGVSVVTVSRALSDPMLVAEETRDRVLESAARLGYTPNLLASWLSSRRSKTIGVIIHELDYAYFSPILSALEEKAREEGYLVIMTESLRQVALEREVVDRFRQLLVSAIVVHPSSSKTEHLEEADRTGTPVIAFARPWAGGDSVAVDNVEAGAIAAQFLLDRIGSDVMIVETEDAENIPARKRVVGFADHFSKAGHMVSPEQIVGAPDTSFESGRAAADRVAERMPRAVFCVTDRLAFGLINRLLERGVRVPEDIAVVGCDNLPQAAYSQVPLTTVKMPVNRMSKLITSMVFDRINQPDRLSQRQELLVPELIVRNSCS